jgi:hypothetical protein
MQLSSDGFLGRGKFFLSERTVLENWQQKMGLSSVKELLDYLNVFSPVGIERWSVHNN